MTKKMQFLTNTVVKDKTAFMIRSEHRLLSLACMLGILCIWELIARLGLISSLFLPAPSLIFMTGYKMVLSGAIFHQIGSSLWRIFWGFYVVPLQEL